MRQYNFVVASNKLHPVLSNINFVSTSYSYLDEVNYSRQSFFLRWFFFVLFFHCISFLIWSKRYYARYLRIPLDFIPFHHLHSSLVRKKYCNGDLIKHSSPYMVTISVSVLRFVVVVVFFLLFFSQFIMKIIIFIDHTSSSAPPPIYLSISCSYFLLHSYCTPNKRRKHSSAEAKHKIIINNITEGGQRDYARKMCNRPRSVEMKCNSKSD